MKHPLPAEKLALSLPRSGSRSVGIVRSRTKATEFDYFFLSMKSYIWSRSANRCVLQSIER
jgi:hypothetical protein